MEKKVLRRVFLSAVFLMSVLAFFSCTIGMGESVDLEAPVLTITSPKNGDFVQKSFTITGTATDNRKVTKVEITYKYKSNGEYIQKSKTASLSGSNWSCDFTFDGDYEVEFEVFAYDAMENGSDDSHQRVMVLIDSQDPTDEKMKITRNGKYISKLIPLSYFTTPETGKTAKKDKSENKDYFQNESFVLSTNLKDNYGIEDVYMAMYEVDASSGAETLIIEKIAPISKDNMYAPSFEITEKMLVDAKPSLASGLHYLKPYVYAKDAAGNALLQKEDYGVLAWGPEYNVPHVSFNTKKDEFIEVTQGASIIVSIFDDDDLKNYSYALVKLDKFEETGKTINDFKPTNTTPLESGLRDTAIEVITEDKKEGVTVIEAAKDFEGNAIALGRYYLVVRVEDVSGRPDGVSFTATEVKIKNEDAPTVFVDSPAENSVPSLSSSNTFTIKGRVSDNEPNVEIAIAWLGPETSPENTTAKIKAAEKYFEKNYKFTADETYGTGNIWFLGKQPDSNTKSSYWSKEFDFFATDYFKNGTDTDNTNKVFVIAAKDPTGNVTTQTFRMSKFTSKPTFEIKYKYGSDKQTTLNSPILEKAPGKQVAFEITPKKQNNMPIVECYVKEGVNKVATWSTPNTTLTFTIADTDAKSGLTKNYTLYAKDKIGGVSEQNLTVRFAEEGKLESVTCNRNSGTIFTAGETIKLQANFSSKVTLNVSSTDKRPYIKLKGTFKDKYGNTLKDADNNEIEYVCAYHEGTGTTEGSTLYFEYDVPEGIDATAITIPTSNTIEKNGSELSGDITTTLEADKTINNSGYTIDSIAPYIKEMTPSKDGVVKKEDGSITLQFEFNENVFVESGTIVMQRTDNWYIPPVLSKEVFEKIWNAATPGDRIELCGSSTELFVYRTDPNGTDPDTSGKVTTMIPTGPYMQYTNGLKVGKGYSYTTKADEKDKSQANSMIPDLETKYVLDYSYNISSTTGAVQNLREVLETHEYHKATFDVTSVRGENGAAINSTTGSKIITLTITDENFIDKLVNGVEYFLTLTPDSFRDKAYNYYKGTNEAGIEKDEYTFWVGPAATPVIRVDRIATNGTTKDANSPTTKGKTNFRIDCVTPGATIDYGVRSRTKNGETAGMDPNNTGTGQNTTKHTYLQDITKGDIEGNDFTKTPSSDITYKSDSLKNLSGSSGNIEIGDGLEFTAQKIAIRAIASKTGMDNSSYGFEGAFKTVLNYVWASSRDTVKIFGCQEPEGSSYAAGWPLTLNGQDFREQYQLAYSIDKTEKDNDEKDVTFHHFYWVSWQILSDFTLQVHDGNNFQNPADPECSYGQYIFAYRKARYGN